MIRPKTLSHYPWVVVRIACALCPRKGTYRLARLAARYGPEQSLDGLLADLASDCPWWRSRPRKYEPRCGARFIDLERSLPPSDEPRGRPFRQREPGREDVPQCRPATPQVPGAVPMLSGWPVPVVTIACDRCGRRDTFVKADLLMTVGDVRLTDLRLTLTAGCPRRGTRSIHEHCGARFAWPDDRPEPSD